MLKYSLAAFAASLVACGAPRHYVVGEDYKRYAPKDEFSEIRELLNESCDSGATVNQAGFICYEKGGTIERRWDALSGAEAVRGRSCIELGDLLIGNHPECHIKTQSDDYSITLAQKIEQVAGRYAPEPFSVSDTTVSQPSRPAAVRPTPAYPQGSPSPHQQPSYQPPAYASPQSNSAEKNNKSNDAIGYLSLSAGIAGLSLLLLVGETCHNSECQRNISKEGETALLVGGLALTGLGLYMVFD